MSDGEEQSLATLLNYEQRGELTVLIANATELMRNDIIKSFEISKDDINLGVADATKELTLESKTVPQDTSALKTASLQQNCKRSENEQSEIAISEPRIQALKSAALNYFDGWRDSVILRVGEAVNSREQKDNSKGKSSRQKPNESKYGGEITPTTQTQTDAESTLVSIYPPQSTVLASLSHTERVTILNAVLLLLLSLESYRAYSRVLLLRLATSLHVRAVELTKMEKDVAYGLLSAASHMDGSSSTNAAQKANAKARKWKVGLASVAGAALIGVTGGLAAPLVAAGVGGLMGGLGLGATAAAGYLGALASSGVLVGGLFGAYGGRMTGKMMDAYAKEVEDFAFVPVKETEDKSKHRLRVTIGISGWLIKEEEVTSPWKVFNDDGEPFALRFELQTMLALGNALQNFVSSMGWAYVKKEVIKRTALAGLYSALMLPIGLLKISRVVDNPFSVAKSRADKAGEILADALINKAQGERPVSLVGFSLGARVIYSCLVTLAKREAFGLVENVVVMGSPFPADAEDWRVLKTVVAGRFVNVYSENDYILSFLYRTSSIQLGIAGLQAVKGIHGIENINVSEQVSGHLRYQYMVGQLLGRSGWLDIDEVEFQKEARVLQRVVAEEEKREKEQDEQTANTEVDERKLDEEAKKLEGKVEIPKAQITRR